MSEPQDHSEPTLADWAVSAWRVKWFIAAGAVGGLSIAALILFLMMPFYRGSMIVAPADGYALGDYATSLTDRARLDIPFWRPKDQEGVSTDYYRFIHTLRGPSVAAILLKDSSVLAGIEHDPLWRRPVGAGESWSAEQLSDYMNKTVRVEHLGTTALRRVSYYHADPVFAAAFLRKIHLVADQLIRRDRRRQSESRIGYLQDSLQQTLNPDHRNGIAALLMQQEHIRMLANLDEAYAAIVVEPPAASARPLWPDKKMVLAVFALLGIAGGYMVGVRRYVG